jgi:sugar lactone lactonase YvrE
MGLVTEISDGINHPGSLAFDKTASLLAVSNTGVTKSGAYNVNVYDTSNFELVRSIHKDVYYPTDLAFDKDGYLYILSRHYGTTLSGGVLVVPPGASNASKIITDGVNYPNSMILGNTGDVYVANGKVCTIHLVCNHGSVSMYESKTFNLIKHTQDGIEGAGKMVIGPKD